MVLVKVVVEYKARVIATTATVVWYCPFVMVRASSVVNGSNC